MKYTQGYGSLVINFDDKGNQYLTPQRGCSMVHEVLPDASEFVTLYAREPMVIKYKGLDFIVYPNMPASVLIREFNKKLDLFSDKESRAQGGYPIMA